MVITDRIDTTGTVTVTGAGSTWSGTFFDIGDRGDGALEILDRARVVSAEVNIGRFGASTGFVRVNGTGSLFEVSGRIEVGFSSSFFAGSATLIVENGGSVESSNSRTYAPNRATVDGLGSSWTTEFDFSAFGADTLFISNGGVVNVGRDMLTGSGVSFSNGTLNTNAILFSPDSLAGTGTVNTNGVIGDFDLVFDSSNGLQQQFVFNSQTGQNITMNLDMSTSANGSLGAGYLGVGSLRIADGVTVESRSGVIGSSRDSNGTATVTGARSTWDLESGEMTVGQAAGAGQLTIENGGKVINGRARIGDGFAANGGDAIVRGTNSTWQNESLEISVGSLTVEDEGLVTVSGRASLGDVATLNGAGTSLIVGDELSVFASSFGAGASWLNIQAGALVVSNGASLAPDNGTRGSVRISGSGSSWFNTGDLHVGVEGGNGVIIMDDGTFVSSDNVSIGIMTFEGGGAIYQTGGTLSVNGGTLSAFFPIQYFFSDGRLEDVGLINLGGPFEQVGGVFAPGGVSVIDGGYETTDAALEIELRNLGTAGEDFDQVSVIGDVVLSSSSRLDLILGYAPSVGDEFLILENDGTDAISGVFAQDSFVIAHFNGTPHQFTINYSGGSGNDITLTSVANVFKLGDCNQDGAVDFLDIAPFISILSATDFLAEADTNEDGMVNFLDIAPFITLLSSQG